MYNHLMPLRFKGSIVLCSVCHNFLMPWSSQVPISCICKCHVDYWLLVRCMFGRIILFCSVSLYLAKLTANYLYCHVRHVGPVQADCPVLTHDHKQCLMMTWCSSAVDFTQHHVDTLQVQRGRNDKQQTLLKCDRLLTSDNLFCVRRALNILCSTVQQLNSQSV